MKRWSLALVSSSLLLSFSLTANVASICASQNAKVHVPTCNPDVTVSEAQPCGLSGNMSERIADCKIKNNIQHYGWELVYATKEGQQGWLDICTGILWGGRTNIKVTFPEALKVCQKVEIDLGIKNGKSWQLPTKEISSIAFKHGFFDVYGTVGTFWWLGSEGPINNRIVYSMETGEAVAYVSDRMGDAITSCVWSGSGENNFYTIHISYPTQYMCILDTNM